jgi:pantothenate kinase
MSSLNADVEAVCAIVRARMVPQGRTIIAIAGPPASGKSTLAEAVVQELSSNVEQAEPIDVPLAVLLPMDGYHLDNRLLESKGRLDRKGAPNTFDAVGFCAGVRRLTEPSYEAFYPMFDRNLDMSIAQAISVHPDTPVVVVEGNYLLLIKRRICGNSLCISAIGCAACQVESEVDRPRSRSGGGDLAGQ